MSTTYLRALIRRELNALERELLAYPDESEIWRVPAGISNFAGTLTLHPAGNLRHFIGAVLGDSGYVRDRQVEFAWRDSSRSELLEEIAHSIRAVERTLDRLPPERLEQPYPLRTASFGGATAVE